MTGFDLEQVRDVLADAFDEQSFDELLLFALDINRPRIVQDDAFNTVVLNVLRKAQQEGWDALLLAKAAERRPMRPDVQEVARKYGATLVGEFNPFFISQIAACVRLWTRSLRRIALTCTLTVASAISSFFAMDLFESPSARQCITSFSRGESCGAVWSVARIGSWSSNRCSSRPRTSGIAVVGKSASPIITHSRDLINTSRVLPSAK